MGIKFFVLGLVLVQVLGHHAYGQETEYTDEPTKESSSFVPDPDPLDPLPVNNLNLKEGDEIILEDIKDILDTKVEDLPTVDDSVNSDSTPDVVDLDASSSSQDPSADNVSGSNSGVVDLTGGASSSTSSNSDFLINDDPDFELENKFHREYRRYHSVPTSNEAWGKVTGSQKEHQYVVQRGDTLYSISQMLFGDSQFWPKLWAMNRSQIFNPHHIQPGMTLYFYAGNVDGAPVLTMEKYDGSKGDGNSSINASAPSQGSGGSGSDGTKGDSEDSKYYSQGTEFDNRLQGGGKIPKHMLPMPIPDSLPTYSHLNLSDNESQINLDLKPVVINIDYIIKNPYVLSKQNLDSNFKVASSSIDRLVCKENQFVPNMIRKKSKQIDESPEAGDYLIVLKVGTEDSFLRNTYIYKKVGAVSINNNNEMRVRGCSYLYNADSLFVTENQLAQLEPPEEKFKQAGILEGLDFQKQSLFTINQLVIMGVEEQALEEGQVVKIHSKEESKVVGKVKVIKRTGNLVIGHISEATDLIRNGDTLVQ